MPLVGFPSEAGAQTHPCGLGKWTCPLPEVGAQHFAAVTVATVVGVFVLGVVLAEAQIII